MKVQKISLSLLEENKGQIEGIPQNPRLIKKDKYEKLKNSIKEDPQFMEARELLVYPLKDKFVVLGGNMRLKALSELGWKEAPCKVFDVDTPVEIMKGRIIKDNVAYGETDWDLLANDWDREQLEEWGMETGKWKEMDEDYSQKLGEIIYEPKETNHKPKDLFKVETKFDKDIEAIKNPELKEMFKARAYNFTFFDFEKLADYYAYQATPEEQRVFEKLALVLLDKDKLIENGFSKLINRIDDKPEDYETE